MSLFCLKKTLQIPAITAVFLAHLFLLSGSAAAGTSAIGTADGSFENGFTGMITGGDVRLVENFGILTPTQGSKAAVLTCEPDEGATPADADAGTIMIENFTIPADAAALRLDYNFLTDEPNPSLTNDRFTVSMILVSSGGEEKLLAVDTFNQFYPAPWTGYQGQTGFSTMQADISAHAGSSDTFSLVLKVEDMGDGRTDSAVLVDNLQFTGPGEPAAMTNLIYARVDKNQAVRFDGLGSGDGDGTITQYYWDFKNGYYGIGPVINYAYPDDGVYQPTLTVTDNEGNSQTTTMIVVVGDLNHAPSITSSPNISAVEALEYIYQVMVSDPEIQYGDTMTFSLEEGPSGMAVDPDTGRITWTPAAGGPRKNPVTVRVTDDQGLSDSQSFEISIGAEIYMVATDDYSRIYTARSNGDGSFGPLTFTADIGHYTRGAAIADFDHDGDFDFVSGHGNNNPYIHLYYYEKQGSAFLPPVYLGPVGDSTHSAGSWLMDMAAEDFNNDGEMDFVVNGDAGSNTWLFLNNGEMKWGQENFFLSDFETDSGSWFGNSYNTGVERVETTQFNGSWSTRVYATANSSGLYYRLRPSDWYHHTGSRVSFAYRMPPGTPATLFFYVEDKGWICLGKSPAGDCSTYPYVNGFELIDDDAWHTVNFDLYEAVRRHWPDAAGRIHEVQWYTNRNASSGQQFWFDDFNITRRTYISGFDVRVLPSTGGNGRGMDAADVNRDGNMDFARARYADGIIYLYTGDGMGGFTTSNVADPGSDPYGTVLADFDEDGKIDLIAVEGGSGNPYFFKGNGNGTFQSGVYIATLDTDRHTSYGVYDFNNDRHQDIVAVNNNGHQVLYYPGNGDASFGTPVHIGTTSYDTLGVAAPAGRVVGQPFTVATQSETVISENESVSFDASFSYDDGTIVAYAWDFGDGTGDSGPASTHSSVSHTYTDEGNYKILVTAVDDEGKKDRRRLNLVVKGTPPSADPGGPYTVGEERAVEGRWAVAVDGSGSSDLETSIIRYEWDFDASDGISVEADTAKATRIYDTPGVYMVTLTVYDEVNQSHSATTPVTIGVADPPVASLSGPALLDETHATLGAWTGWYDLGGSSDDYNIAEFSVDWGDGSSTTLYGMRDEFSDGEYTLSPAWTVNNGTWIVEDEQVRQTSTWGNWMWLQDLSRSYTDFILEVDFKAEGDTDGYMGIVFRNANTKGSTDSYLIYSRNSWDYWSFYDWQTDRTLVTGGTGWDPGIWYHLKLVVQDNMMRLFVTPEGGVETLQIEAPATRHPEGGIGLLAHTQTLVYDNVKVTPLPRVAHTYTAAGEYTLTLTVTDNAGQTATDTGVTTVSANDPPEAHAGGPYTLDEWDAWNGRWDFILDAAGSKDDVNLERYTVDFGDGTSYTTGFGDGKKGSYFAAGTDIYGYDVLNARLGRIIATEDGTTVDIINLDTGFILASNTLNRYQYWDYSPGDGIHFKVKATKPVLAYETNFGSHSAFVPSLDSNPVGKEFIFYRDANQGFYVFAFEDSLVTFYNTSGTIVLQRQMKAGTYWQPGLSETIYRAFSSGRIAMQTTGGNGYTTVPAENGSPVGRNFFCALYDSTTASIAVFAYEDAQVNVYDLDAGLLHTHSMTAGETWYQNGLGTRRLRVESTGDVEVWAGSTESGSGIEYMGDDISVTSGREGKEFYLHNLMDGIVIFAPNNNTQIDIDGGGLTAALNRDEYLHLTPVDLPGGSGTHHIITTEPVVIQTLGRANTYNDMGTYLGGVSARHLYTAPGTYTVTVTAIDNGGQSSTASTTVEVAAGTPPVPDIAVQAVIDEDSASAGRWEVPFDAAGSTDDTEIIRYEWNFGDGTTGTGVNPVHYYSATGTYKVTLTVTDRAGQQASTTFDVEIKKSDPPVARSGGPYVFGEEAARHGVWTASLDGSSSSDDYDIYDFTWIFEPDYTEDFNGTEINPLHWLVSDSAVQDENLAITGAYSWGSRYAFTTETFIPEEGQTIEMRVTTSTGTQNGMFGIKNTNDNYHHDQMPYAIYFDNGTIRIYEGSSNRGSYGSYTRGERYDIRIQLKASGAVYSFKHADATEWTHLYESSYLTGPFRIGATIYRETYTIDDIRLYYRLTGPAVRRSYRIPGEYDVTLTVRDQALQAHSGATTVTIEDGSPPVADAGGSYTVEKGALLLFNGTGSTDDTHIEKYAWTFGDYTADTDAPGRLPYTAEGAAPRHFYRETGTYDVTLTVTDSTGQNGIDTTTVEVVTGAPPVANAGGPYLAGAGGPPAYFDGRMSLDDHGIVEYRWDFDDQVDGDGDGNPFNDIDAVGPAPFHVFPGMAGDGLFIDEGFDGTEINEALWLTHNAVQNDSVVLTGQNGWGSAYLFSAPFERSRVISVTGRVTTSTGNHHSMWGLQDASTTNYGYTNMPHAIYFHDNGSLRIYETGSYRGEVGRYDKGVAYDVRIDIKEAGADYFIKEAGTDTWTPLTGYHSLIQSTRLLRLGVSMYSGTLECDDFTAEGIGPYTVNLTVEDGAGQTHSAATTVQVAPNLPPHVITVPWVAHDPITPHEIYNGKTVHLKGIVRDADPVTFQWDFGDGTRSSMMNVTNPYDLSVTHTYPDAPTGTPFVAVLRVWDRAGQVNEDNYNVIVKNKNLNTEINTAIDEGLWYLHQTQTRTSTGNFPSGYWTSNAVPSATASALQAFQINGHLESSSHMEDPYAETVDRGLKYLFTRLQKKDIGTQTYGEPDTNANAIGLEVDEGSNPYQLGQIMDAIATSGTPIARTVTGRDEVIRRSYFDVLTDLADQYAWGQLDSESVGGGWRYSWNSSSDNSAAQWGAIGLRAAQDIFNIPIPPFVKERNNVWLNYSYDGTGFGYGGRGNGIATTPSGMVQMSFDEQTTDDIRWKTAETWIASNWEGTYLSGGADKNYYAYYALTKAMRLAKPDPVEKFASTGFDWFYDSDQGLARTLIDDQNSDGSFPGNQWIQGQLRSAWGVIILSRTLFVQAPVADAGRDRVWAVDLPLPFDGSNSFHLDPFRSLVKYEWDFDGDGIYDSVSTTPYATFTYSQADYPEPTLPRTITATLRVTDNNIPSLTDTDTVNIIIAIPPHPPVAQAGGPYTCTAGLPCQLDGSGSFDIDPTDFIARYEWEKDTLFPYDFDEADGQTPTVIYDTPGSYTLGLRVWDNGVLNDLDNDDQVDEDERLSDQHFTTVTVLGNLAPVADAGGPYTVDEGSPVILDGSGSSDPNGDPLTYHWDLDGDGDHDDAQGVMPSFTFMDNGTYPVSLKVSDSLLEDTAAAVVTVNDLSPKAAFNRSPDPQTEGTALEFSDTSTSFPDTIIAWSWDFAGLGTSSEQHPEYVFADDGTYTVTLTITDEDGSVSSISHDVTITDKAPTAALTGDAVLNEGAAGSYSAAGSLSHPDAIVSYEWDWNYNGTTFVPSADTGAVQTRLWMDNGTYTVAVRVIDDDGSSDIAQLSVTVKDRGPTAVLSGDTTLVEGSTGSYDAGASTSGPDAIVSYEWDWNYNGTTFVPSADTGAAQSHTWPSHGVYTIAVRVTDEDGSADIASLTVTVTDLGGPVALVTGDLSLDEGRAGNYDATGSSVPQGTIDLYEWDWSYDGTTFIPSGDTGALQSHTWSDNGSYPIAVRVTDDEGETAVASLTVRVNNLAPAVDAGPGANIDSGTAFASAGSFSDPGADTWTASVDYGDGSGSQALVLHGDKTFSLNHTYGDDGVYTVTVTVTDDDGGTGADTAAVTVNPSQIPGVTDLYVRAKSEKTNLVWTHTGGVRYTIYRNQNGGPYQLIAEKTVPGDLDGDADIDGSDLALFTPSLGSQAGDPAYNILADINGDDRVDGEDLHLITNPFGSDMGTIKLVYADFGLTNDITYCYRVRPVNAAGQEGADSNEACATPRNL